MREVIILHPAELQLKGSNRPFFERALLKNIKARFADVRLEVKKKPGKLFKKPLSINRFSRLKMPKPKTKMIQPGEFKICR